jgi:serine/threonine-protein kinase
LLRTRQKLGKYRIIKRIASGPLADVYAATDTIHKTRVALKLPKTEHGATHEDFIREVRLAFKLEHPNILKVQDASFIDGQFVIAMELGVESLADRIVRRISTASALDLADQALAALAHAHEKKIIHCDVKPENFILFPGNRLKLADFGFAKVSLRTLKASGSGTIDYIAPEQAMGRPKFQSDVFSVGLVLYRLFSGKLPEWPYEWPMVGKDRLQARVRPEFAEMLKKAMQIDPAKRYRNAIEMYAAFAKIQSRARRQRNGRKRNGARTSAKSGSAWRKLQWREFQRQFKAALDTRHQCRRCAGPVSESMQACPWCGVDNPARGAVTRMPAHCPRCHRGVKSDWDYLSCGTARGAATR